MSQPLSPAAQAVWDAAWANCPVQCGDIKGTRRAQIAAALRALVQHEGESVCTYDEGKFSVVRDDRILAIAAELEQIDHG